MSDLIVTQLGSLSAVGQGYPIKSKSSGVHTLVVSITGSGALVLVGALMGSNDNRTWETAATFAANGMGSASASPRVIKDYAFWRLDASVLTGTQAVASGVLSTDAGSSVIDEVQSARVRPTINFYGDSFMERGWNGWFAPVLRDTNESTNIAGIGIIGFERKVAAGAKALTYRASDNVVSFNGGAEVQLTNGVQLIPGPTSKTGLLVRVRKVLLPTVDATLTCTPTIAMPNELLLPSSPAFWLGAFSEQGYLLKSYGHVSAQMVDAPSVIDRSTPCQGWVWNCLTNDVVNGDSLAVIQARTIGILDKLYAKARIGIVNAGTLFRPEYNTAAKELVDQYNRWLPVVLRNYPGVALKAPWLRISGDDGVSTWSVMTSDQLHPDEPCAQLAGLDYFNHFNKVLQGTPWDFGAGNGVWSVNNPSGNRLLNPNPKGDVSGLPTGWSFNATTATGSATSAKEARTDGVAGDWAVITGSASADQTPHWYTLDSANAGLFVTGSVPQPGQLVQLFVEVKLSGALQMCPALRVGRVNGSTLTAYSRISFGSTKPMQLTSWSGVLATPPFEFDSTDTNVRLLIQQMLLNGASNAKLYVGRIWFGTPAEPTINATL